MSGTELPTLPTLEPLHAELRKLIAASRQRLSAVVNAELSRLYWTVGRRLTSEVLGGERARYGAQLMVKLGERLAAEFGRGFEAKNLRRMVQFAQAFPEPEKVASLMRQLSWTHFLQLLPLRTERARWYYAQQCITEHWSVRELRRHVDRKTFERSQIASAQSPTLPAMSEPLPTAPALVFKDPYFLDFLGLKGSYSEKDLETAILHEMEAFILELGAGFAFVARQMRIVIDGKDHYIDLLFYHRQLKRLVAIELKLEEFQAAHKGQMELYLRWLNKHEKQPGEEVPIGLILCEKAGDETVELLELEASSIRVASYLTQLPPKELLQKKLHTAAELARQRLENDANPPE